jgi:hypothetical protein
MAHEGSAMTRRVTRRPASPGPLAAPLSAPPLANLASRRTLTVTASFRVTDEGARTRLIGELSCLLNEPALPESTRSAGLELIGWLARRMPGEPAHALGVEEALLAKRAGRKTR